MRLAMFTHPCRFLASKEKSATAFHATQTRRGKFAIPTNSRLLFSGTIDGPITNFTASHFLLHPVKNLGW